MAYNNNDTNWLNDWLCEDDATLSDDPFNGIHKPDQDLFFKMLDLMPDEYREDAMDYFMGHPAKLRSIIKNIKLKKTLIKNKDQAGLNDVLAQEYQLIKQYKHLDEAASLSADHDDSNAY